MNINISNLNITFIVVALIVLIFALVGYKKGLIKSLKSLLAVILALVVAYYSTPYVTGYIIEKTGIVDKVTEMLQIDSIGSDMITNGINELKNSMTDEEYRELQDSMPGVNLDEIEQGLNSGELSVNDVLDKVGKEDIAAVEEQYGVSVEDLIKGYLSGETDINTIVSQVSEKVENNNTETQSVGASESVKEQTSDKANVKDEAVNPSAEGTNKNESKGILSADKIGEYLGVNNVVIPKAATEKLNSLIEEALTGIQSKGLEVINGLVKNVVDYVFRALVYIAIYFIALIIIRLLFELLNSVVENIIIVSGINKFFGLVFGLVRAYIWITLAAIIVMYLSPFGFAEHVMKDIASSSILTYIYEHNLILTLIMKK